MSCCFCKPIGAFISHSTSTFPQEVVCASAKGWVGWGSQRGRLLGVMNEWTSHGQQRITRDRSIA